jgi:peroxiredoxin
MPNDYSKIPPGLPVPEDDGAANHLLHLDLPALELRNTDGSNVDLSQLKGYWILYVYPMTGQPGVALPDGWNEIPGARGCTPQSCSFRDHHYELQALNVGVFGLSAQDSDYQREARDRLHLPFQLLSDPDLLLKQELKLPTFQVAGMELFKRLTIIANDARIEKVFYPVFPPDRNADEVLSWLRGNAQ